MQSSVVHRTILRHEILLLPPVTLLIDVQRSSKPCMKAGRAEKVCSQEQGIMASLPPILSTLVAVIALTVLYVVPSTSAWESKSLVTRRPSQKYALKDSLTVVESVDANTNSSVFTSTDQTNEDNALFLSQIANKVLPTRKPKNVVEVKASKELRKEIQSETTIRFQNFLRDAGILRVLMDTIISLDVPRMVVDDPQIVPAFLQLTQRRQSISYGQEHKMQVMDIFASEKKPQGLVFFVHGGAWGSGLPWMYRLVAESFLTKNILVAVVGYRTYPDGDVSTQVEDLESAAVELARLYPELCSGKSEYGVCAIGHSSGAHIALLMLVERVRKTLLAQTMTDTTGNEASDISRGATPPTLKFDAFVGISGPYDIASHFDFETLRGVEELSPLKPACGFSIDGFRKHSPALLLSDLLTNESGNTIVQDSFPRVLLIHGTDDAVVPSTATSNAAEILRSCGVRECEEIQLAGSDHVEPLFELMFGGSVRDFLLQKLEQWSRKNDVLQMQNFRKRRTWL